MIRLILLVFLLGLATRLCAQKNLPAIYKAPWGSELTLKEDKTFDYSSFECTHWVTAIGRWTYSDDTLRLTTTNLPGLDSIVEIEHSKIELDGIRVLLTDKNANVSFFTSVVAYSNGDSAVSNTGIVGFVDFELSNIDSLKIGPNSAINVFASRKDQNQIAIFFFNLDLNTRNFDDQPFLVRRNKLYYVYEKGISKKKYFRKE